MSDPIERRLEESVRRGQAEREAGNLTSLDDALAEAEQLSRMSINLSADARDFLAEVTAEDGISYTEAVRRALSIYRVVRASHALRVLVAAKGSR